MIQEGASFCWLDQTFFSQLFESYIESGWTKLFFHNFEKGTLQKKNYLPPHLNVKWTDPVNKFPETNPDWSNRYQTHLNILHPIWYACSWLVEGKAQGHILAWGLLDHMTSALLECEQLTYNANFSKLVGCKNVQNNAHVCILWGTFKGKLFSIARLIWCWGNSAWIIW